MENGRKWTCRRKQHLPKKNGLVREALKSLGATIQDVISKAVTRLTDGKIDFTRG